MFISNSKTSENSTLDEAALEYHSSDPPGKLCIQSTKSLSNQHDLSLAYTPGVGAVCEAIAREEKDSFKYTNRGNLVGVISNGTAVLGLGDIGPAASKPVMEGKAVLFKKFSGIDVFDIEINEKDPDKLVDIIASLEPTFGGINLEDIRAPECFIIEEKLRNRCKIPIFHDDQHGTAIVVSAAIMNALILTGRKLEDIAVTVSGAGAAAISCIELLVDLGLRRENVLFTDRAGVIYRGRPERFSERIVPFVRDSEKRTLEEALEDVDLFLGLSAGGVLKPEFLHRMKSNPIIMALANPYPEILPEKAFQIRSDAIIATGRSDYPNQVNNVLCFPYIFRGALDCGATQITRGMEVAAVKALAEIAREEIPETVAKAYSVSDLFFGKDYLIPKPFDSRLISRIAPAVAKAAEQEGVALRPIVNYKNYIERLNYFTIHSGNFMKPVFTVAKKVKKDEKRLVICEGEEESVLRASQILVDENLARPVLLARPKVLETRIKRYGLRLKIGQDIDVVNPESDERYYEYWNTYYQLAQRKGINKLQARYEMRNQMTLIGSMLLHKKAADAMLCGLQGSLENHLNYIDLVIGRKENSRCYASLNALLLPQHQIFLVDTDVNYDPSAEELVDITVAASAQIRMFGVEPRIALLSHSNFGSSNYASAKKMREAYLMIKKNYPKLVIEGEMQGDMALRIENHIHYIDQSALGQSANLLVFPNLDAANIACKLLKAAAGNNIAIGNILLGSKYPVAILNQAATVRRIVNLGALVVAQASRILN